MKSTRYTRLELNERYKAIATMRVTAASTLKSARRIKISAILVCSNMKLSLAIFMFLGES
ncbi:hypothetical protein SADUNF_Sadunf13G0012700 [Salix dunnii]|uniref:Uncharacterized protein n=1 Tax=Salix dunnii TaxID=1413687 RepID=A0A835JIG6_9ROSI|nr:hypothetical protein SADUNF_Sadunf13G0012700 [Salix dunnii]